MNLIRTFIANFAHPNGVLGRVVAWRLDISNRQANQWTLSLLNLQPSDQVLEVGFGSGRTLKIAASKTPLGFVSGVDSSPTMLEIARKRNAQSIMSGHMDLKLGEMESLGYPDDHFDKVFAVEVINYIADPLKGFMELHRVLRPGGRVALFFEAKDKFTQIQELIKGIYRPYDAPEVVAMLREAGFSRSWFEEKDFVARRLHYTGYVALGEKEPISSMRPSNSAQGAKYAFHVRGYLPSDWYDWFEGFVIHHLDYGDTILSGDVPDQAALHGVLVKIRDLNLTLISVRQE